MSLNSTQSSPPKRPRLTLQIKTPATAQILGRSATALKSDIDPSSPTAFNTISNAYALAIENASPRSARPLTTSCDTKPARRTQLRLETSNFSGDRRFVQPSQQTQTPGLSSITCLDTPSSVLPGWTPTAQDPQLLTEPKSTTKPFTFTPPQSAGTDVRPGLFNFAANMPSTSSPSTPRTPRRRMTICSQSAPYTHPRSLRSILRNSPLPPRSTITPVTPSRVSMRLAKQASKKVGYNDPLTQTITTNKYVKSHIDLLSEDSPYSATDPEFETAEALDLAMAYTGDEKRDGGQTPGPFEEMRRRMAESDLETPGTLKRKRKDKKRQWEWTINTTEIDDRDDMPFGRAPLTGVILERMPIVGISREASVSESSEASEAEERFVPPSVSEDSMSERDDWNGSVHLEIPGSFHDSYERPTTSHSL
ncbi:unnamed protein product [Diplocarpon coronariae]|uniref:Uncharacterized protein n=1 Tax=Diplocarpon coronariae TaxID=2795749 RepID=A0A218Z7P9_9HELO|nr:hypothetical protein JHW43_003270 [Diplocarpon mali]OWP04097.1 hypothetical protein B2J93_5918 [Marssonina coronariae]